MDAAGLAARLADFCHGDIALQIPGELDLTPWQAPAATIPRLSARELQRRIADDWAGDQLLRTAAAWFQRRAGFAAASGC